MELSGLRKEGQSPKRVIEQQEQKANNTIEKLVLAWYSGYAEKFRKKPAYALQPRNLRRGAKILTTKEF